MLAGWEIVEKYLKISNNTDKSGENLGKKTVSIDAINRRLKAANVPVRVRQHGNALYLRSSKLPPKPEDPVGKRYEMPKGPASQENLLRMEQEAHSLWKSVVEQRFNWPDHDHGVKSLDTVREWIARFEKHYLKTTDCSPRTFEKHWRAAVLNTLPQGSKLDRTLLLAAVLSTPDNTRKRKQFCQKLTRLAEFAGIDIDLRPYQGSYSKGSVQSRDLPKDAQIEAWYDSIPDERWKRIFARIVIFGLRPSESFDFELVDTHTARVIDAKSNEPRIIKAFHPTWAEAWDLDGQLPKINWRKNRKHEDITSRIANRFKCYDVTCQRYDLRHAWCVRVSVEYRIPVEVAAKWAGHSADVHQSIYNRWIRSDQQDQIYQEMVLKRETLQ
ncbi:MAG: hypothetical protein F6K00_29870 [Leptolyngbya sp. SIOISBB]|nr:hypothetical protein [Leptolyngbya sp. SIOISBB]